MILLRHGQEEIASPFWKILYQNRELLNEEFQKAHFQSITKDKYLLILIQFKGNKTDHAVNFYTVSQGYLRWTAEQCWAMLSNAEQCWAMLDKAGEWSAILNVPYETK